MQAPPRRQLYQQTLSGMSNILNNKDIDPTRAAADITIMLNNLNGAFKVMNEVEGGTAGGVAVPGATNGPTAPQPPMIGFPGGRPTPIRPK